MAAKLRERLAEARDFLIGRRGRPALSGPARYAREVAVARREAANEADA